MDIVARGHQIITEAMAKAKAAELAVSKNVALSAALESCMRDLWALMSNPEETAAQREAVEKQGVADLEAAAQAEIDAKPQDVSAAPTAVPAPDEPIPDPPASIDVDPPSETPDAPIGVVAAPHTAG